MNIIILGGGLAGCTVAYLLRNKGFETTIIDRNPYVGGLCQTHTINGINYEFGPHVLYADRDSEVQNFFQHFFPNFEETKYFPRLSVDGDIDELGFFPPTAENIFLFTKEEQIKAIEELYQINLTNPNTENLEQFIKSRVGSIIYDKNFKNYNLKHWGLHPKNMSAEWAKFRNFYLRPAGYGMFGNAWQGHPGSYQDFFNQLTQGTEIIQANINNIIENNGNIKKIITDRGEFAGDYYISTIPLDQLITNNCTLEYRGVAKLFFLLEGKSKMPTYLTTFPNNYSFTRTVDYTLQSNQKRNNSLMSFAFPYSSLTNTKLPLDSWKKEAVSFIASKNLGRILEYKCVMENNCYPVSSPNMLLNYNTLIGKVSNIGNMITLGRLGLYAYISMCTIVKQALEVSENFENILIMNYDEKIELYKKLRENLK